MHVPDGTFQRWRDLAAPAAAAAPGVIKRVSQLCKVFEKKKLHCLSLTDRLAAAILTSFHIYVFFEPRAIKAILQMYFRGLSAAKEELFSFFFFFSRHAEVRPCWHWPTLSSSLPWGPTSFSDLYLLRARLRRSSFGITNRSEKKNFGHLQERSDLTLCLQPLAETLTPHHAHVFLSVLFHWLHHTICDFPMCWECLNAKSILS